MVVIISSIGSILTSVKKQNQDVFANNYEYLCNQSLKAIYCFRKKLKDIGVIPPKIMFYIFATLVRPILTYGSDVWGISKKGLSQLDKVFLHFARCVLHVKSTTCNTIVYGECGQFPPSVFCQINTLCFLNRVENAQEGKIVKLFYLKNCVGWAIKVSKPGLAKHMSWQTAAVSTQIWLHALIRNCLKDTVKSSSWKSLSICGNKSSQHRQNLFWERILYSKMTFS